MKKLTDLKLKKNKSGLYKLYDKDKNLIYIGKSSNLKSRITSSCRYRLQAKYVSIMLIDDLNSIDLFKYKLINKYKPIFNKDTKSIFNKYVAENFMFFDMEENFSDLMLVNIEQIFSMCTYKIIKHRNKDKILLIYHADPNAEELIIPEGIKIDEVKYNGKANSTINIVRSKDYYDFVKNY